MIPKDYITAWRAHAPWRQDAQVEQDLVINRAIIEMFRVEDIADRLAFRGGTALNKLYLQPAARYSEDIDLVQIKAEPIGETLDMVRDVLDPWLGKPQRKLKEGRVNLVYRFESEDTPPLKMRLKVETNSREHFTELGLTRVPSHIDSRWFTGEAEVTTYEFHANSCARGEKGLTAPWSGTASKGSGWAHSFNQTIPLPAGPGREATGR